MIRKLSAMVFDCLSGRTIALEELILEMALIGNYAIAQY
jgi:hypothetical protein